MLFGSQCSSEHLHLHCSTEERKSNSFETSRGGSKWWQIDHYMVDCLFKIHWVRIACKHASRCLNMESVERWWGDDSHRCRCECETHQTLSLLLSSFLFMFHSVFIRKSDFCSAGQNRFFPDKLLPIHNITLIYSEHLLSLSFLTEIMTEVEQVS